MKTRLKRHPLLFAVTASLLLLTGLFAAGSILTDGSHAPNGVYEVTFDFNGGRLHSAPLVVVEVDHGWNIYFDDIPQWQQLTPPGPGRTFQGWRHVSRDVVLTTEQVYASRIWEPTTFIAEWNLVEHSVIFHLDLCETNPCIDPDCVLEKSIEIQVESGAVIGDATMPQPRKPGYILHWQQNPRSPLLRPDEVAEIPITRQMSFFAIWTENPNWPDDPLVLSFSESRPHPRDVGRHVEVVTAAPAQSKCDYDCDCATVCDYVCDCGYTYAEVELWLHENPGVGTFTINITFDQTRLELLRPHTPPSAEDTAAHGLNLIQFPATNPDGTLGNIMFMSQATPMDATGTGRLITLRFAVRGLEDIPEEIDLFAPANIQVEWGSGVSLQYGNSITNVELVHGYINIVPNGGTVQGTVRDEDGNPLSGATVTLFDVTEPMGPPRTIEAGSGGRYLFDDVPPGTYIVIARKPGYAPSTPIRVNVTDDYGGVANLRLRPLGPGESDADFAYMLVAEILAPIHPASLAATLYLEIAAATPRNAARDGAFWVLFGADIEDMTGRLVATALTGNYSQAVAFVTEELYYYDEAGETAIAIVVAPLRLYPLGANNVLFYVTERIAGVYIQSLFHAAGAPVLPDAPLPSFVWPGEDQMRVVYQGNGREWRGRRISEWHTATGIEVYAEMPIPSVWWENGRLHFYADKVSFLFGDVNRDGLVNASDLALLGSFVAGNSVDICLWAADLNGDGLINAAVLSMLGSLVAGNEVNIGSRQPQN